MVLHQNEAAKFRAEMPFDPLRQRRQDRSSIWRHPAFALVTGRAHGNHQILNQKRLVSLEARSGRDRGVHHLLFNAYPRRDLAPPLRRLIGLRWLGAFVHAARPDLWTSLETFETRDLFAQFDVHLFQAATSPNSSTSRASSSGRLSPDRECRG